MEKLYLSCKKATELIELKSDTQLSFKANIQLKMHLMMCKACNAYEKQSAKLNKMLGLHFDVNTIDESEIILNKELKEKIISKL